MKVLVVGGSGLLGHALLPELASRGHLAVAPARSDLDVTGDPGRIRRVVKEASPEWVVNLAAYTRVDEAEKDAETAFRVNRDGAGALATAAAGSGASFLQLSTDYVFDGDRDRPYSVDAPIRPLGVYGLSKAEGEAAVRRAGGPHLIVRTSWLYGGGGPNFVDTIVGKARRGERVQAVSDRRGRPTWTASLAEGLVDLMEKGERGTLHLSDEGEASWYELAVEAVRLAGCDATVHPVTAAERGDPAPRPAYSALDLSVTRERLGRPLPHWTTSLERYL